MISANKETMRPDMEALQDPLYSQDDATQYVKTKRFKKKEWKQAVKKMRKIPPFSENETVTF